MVVQGFCDKIFRVVMKEIQTYFLPQKIMLD